MTRITRAAACWLLAASVLFLGTMPVAAQGEAAKKEAGKDRLWVYIGTYTQDTPSKGIYRCALDLSSGKLTKPEPVGQAINPSFLAIHPTKRFLYSVAEVADSGPDKAGAVVAFAIDPKTGTLKRLNQQSSGGAAPCHLVVDKAGKYVLTANYTGGSVCVHAIEEDGSLGKRTGFQQHKGTSTDPKRQEAPHAHSVRLDAANRFAFVADLGLDKIMIYRFENGKLTPTPQAFEELPPGSGPRHFTFHPNNQLAFVICELGNLVTSFRYNPDGGRLKTLHRIGTLPEGYKKPSYTAEVVVHPDGQFVYGSNRGHDSIAILKVDQKTGEFQAVGFQGEGIKTPRNFNIDPTGKFLIVANQDGDNLLVFRIDPKTGELQPTGHRVEVPRPVCVQFLSPPQAQAQPSGKIPVLIIDGINNHDWVHTTPFLKAQLEKTGKFTVDVSTTPPGNASKEQWANWQPDFSKYKVVLSNYNGPQWPAHVRPAFEQFIRDGGGLVNVHAANNAHSGWMEFEKMTGLLWRGANGGWRLAYNKDKEPVRVPPKEGQGAGHGPQHGYEVTVIDDSHPITKGMPMRWLHTQDELYHNQRGPAENMHVLAIAFDAKNKGGTDMYEPMLWWIPYGKGKAVTTVLGHVNNGDGKNMIAMRDVGFLTIVARACEWAATGQVTIPVPDTFPTADKTSVVPSPGETR